MDTKEFGSFIASQRKAKGLTQKELADKLMVTDKAVSRWENGHGYPDIGTLEDLASALGISLLELMHSKRQEDVSVSLEEANRTLSDTIRLNIDDRKKERKITALIFSSSMVLMFVFSVFKDIAPVAMVFEAVGAVYLIASVVMLLDSKRNRDMRSLFIGILLLLIPLFILLLLLSVSVTTYN
ncbi:MAG: helix-turn-helix transcriptional regulator [Clostridiales bacterium]|nr:helix-turn-helix transcriptional regulator [Clostridiales bacterium]